jgi:hypothetical protein
VRKSFDMLERQMPNAKHRKTLRGMFFWMVLLLFLLPVAGVFAQEEIEPVPLTDTDWTKFATVEVMTSDFLAKKTKELKTWVRSKQDLGGGARFNEIKGAWGNVGKETSISITVEEKVAYKAFLDQQAILQKEVIAYQVDLIRDDKLLGLELYERIAALVEEDPMLKEKLDQEIRRLKKKKR